MRQNKDIEEAKFIAQINIESIENSELSGIESKLEKYDFKYRDGKKEKRKQICNFVIYTGNTKY